MKAVFRVANRLRAGAPIPRNFLPIAGLPHLGLCYQQRIYASPEEFNSTLATINDPRFPRRGATIEAYMLTAADEAALVAVPAPPPVSIPEPEVVEQPVEAVEQELIEEATVEAAPSPSKFRMEGNSIFQGEERVGGIFDYGIRCAKGYADLRDELEAWLKSQPQ